MKIFLLVAVIVLTLSVVLAGRPKSSTLPEPATAQPETLPPPAQPTKVKKSTQLASPTTVAPATQPPSPPKQSKKSTTQVPPPQSPTQEPQPSSKQSKKSTPPPQSATPEPQPTSKQSKKSSTTLLPPPTTPSPVFKPSSTPQPQPAPAPDWNTADTKSLVVYIGARLLNVSIPALNKFFSPNFTNGTAVKITGTGVHTNSSRVFFYVQNKPNDNAKNALFQGVTAFLGTFGVPAARVSVSVQNVSSPKRSIEEEQQRGRSWALVAQIVDPAQPKPQGPTVPGYMLYIIIGVVVATAIIITTVLVITLRKKPNRDAYQPLDTEHGIGDKY